MNRKVACCTGSDPAMLQSEITKFFNENTSPRWRLVSVYCIELNIGYLHYGWLEYENGD